MAALDTTTRPLVPASFPVGRAWFVACVLTGREAKVSAEIKSLGFSTYIPTERKKRCGKVLIAPLFPGYVFIKFDRERDDWGAIDHIDGVLGVLKNLDLPRRVADRDIARLQCAEAAGVFDYTRPAVNLSEGESVSILEGPFVGLIAKVRSASSKNRARILLEHLGTVEIDPCFLRKLD